MKIDNKKVVVQQIRWNNHFSSLRTFNNRKFTTQTPPSRHQDYSQT